MKQRKLTEEQITRANRLRMLWDGDGKIEGTCVGIEEPTRWALIDGQPVLLRKSDAERWADKK